MASLIEQSIFSYMLQFATYRFRRCYLFANIHIHVSKRHGFYVRPSNLIVVARPTYIPNTRNSNSLTSLSLMLNRRYIKVWQNGKINTLTPPGHFPVTDNYQSNLLIYNGANNIGLGCCCFSTHANLCVEKEIPGEDALLKRELDKMESQTGLGDDRSYEKEYQKLSEHDVRRRRAIKYTKAAKDFPQDKRRKRQLTWDSIEQIQYLRQEHPDEWSTVRLAESFEVPEQIIKKVLKSKFVPDSRQRHLQDRLALGSVDKQKTADQGTNLIQGDKSTIPTQSKPKEQIESSSGHYGHRGKLREEDNIAVMRNSGEIARVQRRDHVEDIDFEVVDNFNLEEELEEAEAFSSLGLSDFEEAMKEENSPPKVIQKGREFYDADGEFLFKI